MQMFVLYVHQIVEDSLGGASVVHEDVEEDKIETNQSWQLISRAVQYCVTILLRDHEPFLHQTQNISPSAN